MLLAAINLTLASGASGPGLSVWLGQITRIEQATSRINFYLIVMTCTFLALAVVGLIARKWFNSPTDAAQDESTFNLSDLRRMHRDGELTDDEYLVARAAALAESGVYSDKEASDTSTSESGVTQNEPSNPRNDKPTSDLPASQPGRPGGPGGPGVELGPELLDTPETPPEPNDKPDNPG